MNDSLDEVRQFLRDPPLEPDEQPICPRLGETAIGRLTEDGKRRLGKYRLLREIARGGMGVVFEAEDTDLKRKVALKVLKEVGAQSADIVRLRREASLAAQLSHPNIIKVYEIGSVEGEGVSIPLHYIAMDYIEGKTLTEALRCGSTDSLLKILETVADAVGYAHEHSVIHRDLKPPNILIATDGRPVVTDFGLAREEGEATRVTFSGAVMGTPQFMAPEQVYGDRSKIGPWTDVWALGVILYEMLTKRRPFAGTNDAEVFQGIIDENPIPPRYWDKTVPRDLQIICLKALEKEPHRRYARGKELSEDLRRWLRGEPILARRAGVVYRSGKWIRRRRAWIGAVGTALLMLVSLGWALSRFKNGREFEEAHLEARKAYAAGDWERVLAYCERALRIGEDAGLQAIAQESRKYAAERATELRLRKSIAWAEELLQQTRQFSYVPEIDMPAELKKVKEALEELRRTVQREENLGYAPLWKVIGLGWYLVGDMDRAEEALLEAVQKMPDDGWVNFTLGKICLRRSILETLTAGNLPHAIHKEKNAVSKEWSERALGYLERPVQGWTGAQEIDRHIARAYRALAEVDVKEVLRLCQEGLDRFPDKLGREEFWNLAGYMKDGQEAVDDFTQAIKRRPNDPWAYFLRGRQRSRMEDRVGEMEDYDRAIALGLRQASVYNNRGFARKVMGELDAAMEEYSRAIQIDPSYWLAYVNRGWVRMHTGDFEGALSDASAVIRLLPDLSDGYYCRANALRAMGNLEGAIRDYDEALRIQPDFPDALNNRGFTREAKGDLRGAISDYRRALEVAPVDWKSRPMVERNLRRLETGQQEY